MTFFLDHSSHFAPRKRSKLETENILLYAILLGIDINIHQTLLQSFY